MPTAVESRPDDAPVRVLLVDDHALVRRGLRHVLAERGLEIVGEAGDGAAAVRLVLDRRPEVVLMDLNMPGTSGIEATRELARRAPGVRVVVLTISASSADILAAITAGACGYLLKTAPPEEVEAAVRAAAAGQTVISPTIASTLVDHVREHERLQTVPRPVAEELSEREVEVLRLLAEGRENAEIAQELYISLATVKHHISNILTKLGAKNRVEAAVLAVRGGVLATG